MLYFVYFIKVGLKIWTSDGSYCFASNINLKMMLVESQCDVIQIEKSLWFSWLYKSALLENIFKVPYIIWRCSMNMDIFNFSELIMFSSKTVTCICIWKLKRKKVISHVFFFTKFRILSINRHPRHNIIHAIHVYVRRNFLW